MKSVPLTMCLKLKIFEISKIHVFKINSAYSYESFYSCIITLQSEFYGFYDRVHIVEFTLLSDLSFFQNNHVLAIYSLVEPGNTFFHNQENLPLYL